MTGYTPDEPDDVLGTDWFVFKKGEPRIEGVWRWFDSLYTAGIGALMSSASRSTAVCALAHTGKRRI